MNLDSFISELKKIGIIPTQEQLNSLETYYNYLIENNKNINLTAITKKEDVYLKHFYDSLTLIKIVDLNNIQSLCDVGTGAGFPGIVLKIFYPKIEIVLLDSLNKRVLFLKRLIEKLQLKKIEVIHCRVEEYAKENRDKFEIVTARAVAPLNILLEYCIPMLRVNGKFIPMKSSLNQEEYKKAMIQLNSKEMQKLEFKLPIENSKRTLIIIEKKKTTNRKYPRKNTDILKRPL